MKKSRFLTVSILFTVLVLMASCVSEETSGELISGASKRKQKIPQYVSGTASTVYTVPAMNNVQVLVDSEYAEDRKMDIYYPPAYDFSQPLPVVVFVNGLNTLDTKDLGNVIDWGLLTAANGMIAVTYNTLYPDKDIRLVFEHLVDNAGSLGIDKNRLGVFSYCGSCYMGTNVMKMNDSFFNEGLKTSVFLYGVTPWSEDLNPDTSVLLVHTGNGITENITESMLSFHQSAERNGMRSVFLDYEDGYKYFDWTENPKQPWEYGVDPKFTADCDTMKEILTFMKQELSVESGVS